MIANAPFWILVHSGGRSAPGPCPFSARELSDLAFIAGRPVSTAPHDSPSFGFSGGRVPPRSPSAPLPMELLEFCAHSGGREAGPCTLNEGITLAKETIL